jgi:hypothetical protein
MDVAENSVPYSEIVDERDSRNSLEVRLRRGYSVPYITISVTQPSFELKFVIGTEEGLARHQ